MSKLTPSQQDYLEAILDLGEGSVRSIDIATALGFSRASVNKAIQSLKAQGLIEHGHYGQITLTESGLLEERAVRRRHNLLKTFLKEILGVAEATAEEDACRMEHVVSPESLEKLESFTEHYLQKK